MSRSDLSWRPLFFVTFLAAYLYVFNEWLFAITKPYFLSDLSLIRQLQILLTIGALLAGLCFLALLPLLFLGILPPLKRYTTWWMRLGALLPAVLFASLALIMLDNFTYTVFKWGIVSTQGWTRALYGIGFILAILLLYRRTLKTLDHLNRGRRIRKLSSPWLPVFLAGLVLLPIAWLAFPDPAQIASLSTGEITGAGQRPHILLITVDGVDANHMSVYGYERDTTPHIRQLAESALIAENAFANSGNSPGSIISLYTGKYPAKTRVLYPPNILQGSDSHEHLPAILRSQGYKTVQITFPYYLDARTLNVVDGFDEVKMNSADPSKYLIEIGKILPNDYALFTDEIIKRLGDRIRHIFFIEEMDNPYLMVTGMHVRRVDIERWLFLRQAIQSARQPLFVHVHLMVTHGMDFFPMEQTFSAGQSLEDQKPWSDDFYDDSILDFDQNVGELVDDLTEQSLLDNTILILGSDHGQKWDSLKRVPLIIRFPHGQYAGRIQVNVQNLDIAPTLLDHLGLTPADWMRGASLISGELEQRPIFSASIINEETDPDKPIVVDWTKAVAPFYQFGDVSVIYCQEWFRLDLSDLGWERGMVEGSTSVCPSGNEITDQQIFQWMVEHLDENGFDVSTLDQKTPWRK